MVFLWVTMLGAFVLGSMPFGWWVGKWYGIDITSAGSGSTGATNVARLVGLRAALLTFVLDSLKGYIVVRVTGEPWTGLAVVMGHVLSFWRRGKGGKGVATASGVVAALNPGLAGLLGLVWIVIFYLTRLASVASLSVMMLACGLLLKISGTHASVLCIMSCFILWAHRHNLKRLWQGKELALKKREAKDEQR